ncbi:MAG TPA: DUF1905 domain-containing protein [Candidatus Thermoplasmatota archaeon]|nr:DUF1905 domain-containing protein [Candidatus Thermoplasmatota archaeon]
MPLVYDLKGKAWLHPGQAAWVFVTLPKGPSTELRDLFGAGRGWGSIPVQVTIGGTTWRTSVFPDKASGGYVLPLKAAVRKAEGILVGKSVACRLEFLA